jgi:hypothetical protein
LYAEMVKRRIGFGKLLVKTDVRIRSYIGSAYVHKWSN